MGEVPIQFWLMPIWKGKAPCSRATLEEVLGCPEKERRDACQDVKGARSRAPSRVGGVRGGGVLRCLLKS
jgi:hypothetical protein